ncbi:3-phenylpropionate/cinnamic acid dioxygenase, small subunit [Raineyella antarctica]|uniref:3-phenylpropionate/cinnamic acid dioxygenase, small subunit n=1 Tax=Raineyella antarctica TaxID=1577474 RepID=A0A1G6GFI9_9ACTN|nr:3-phenylpropionate/cinnamic acid dioxygenase subunit beta [Raineyella antarctica]SDB80583.1 3-phenylpropionate/cinnamic acid dioxygenase, small subunit [Raineyella antarctica]
MTDTSMTETGTTDTGTIDTGTNDTGTIDHLPHPTGFGPAADAQQEVEGPLVDAGFGYLVQQFYYHEAEVLDEGRYADWLELFDDDLHYWLPTRSNRTRRQQALSVARPGEAAFYDETKESLAWRIRRYDSGMAWSEDPPSRTRHLVTNVVVRRRPQTEQAGTEQSGTEPVATETGTVAAREFTARSAFIVYRSRLEREVDIYAGSRTDLLRLHPDGRLRVARRTILLESNVLLAKNISTFF